MELSFDDKQEFAFTGKKSLESVDSSPKAKFTDEHKGKIMAAVEKLQKEGVSIDKMLVDLKKQGFKNVPSKGTLHGWIKNKKDVQSDKFPDDHTSEQV